MGYTDFFPRLEGGEGTLEPSPKNKLSGLFFFFRQELLDGIHRMRRVDGTWPAAHQQANPDRFQQLLPRGSGCDGIVDMVGNAALTVRPRC